MLKFLIDIQEDNGSVSKKLIANMTSVPYKRKKVRKVRNFFRHFRTEILRIPAFFLPPKTGVFVSRQKP